MVILICAVAVATTLGLVTTHCFKMPPDNPIEEICEGIIEKQIGLPEGAVDLTPLSKEVK